MNGKTEYHNDVVFNSIINIIALSRQIDINMKSIVTDSELALVKIVKKYFANSLRITCLFILNKT